jgi:CheY-like chemotaxis protein
MITPARRMMLEGYLGTEEILIVDDVPEQVEIASKMLTKLGYNVSSVASGEAAVRFVQKRKADLLVLDMIMPGGMDGLETCKRIIAIRPDQRAIITSGFAASERAKKAQELGAGAFIHKPYALETTGIAVRKELNRQRKA